MTCKLCSGTGYAYVTGGVAPCACEIGQKIGQRPKRKKAAAKKAEKVAKAHWKQWNKTLERMGAK
jgi:hypothetical protein